MRRPAAAPAGPAGQGVARGGLANLLGAGLAGLTGVAVTWLVARGLGTEPAGAFFAATAAFVLVSAVAKLGTQTGLVYWPARLRATGQAHLLGSCLRTGLVPVAVTSLVLAVGLWAAAPAVARFTAADAAVWLVAEHTSGLRMLALFLPLAALTDALLTATRGYRLMRPTVLLDRVLRSVLQLAGIAALAVLGLRAGAGLPAYAVAWAAPYLPVALLAGHALVRAYRRTPVDRPSRRAERDDLRRRFWRFTGPRAAASVAQLALQRIDVLLVAAFGSLSAAAVYAVAGRFVVAVQFANQGLSQAVQPRLAEALAVGDRAAANALYQRATGWLVLATWPVHLLVISFAPVYLGLFGAAYRDGAAVVVVLASAMLVATGCGMVDMVLAMAGRTRWNLGNVLVALAVTVVLDIALIPRYGALGAAIGLAAAVVTNNLLPLVQVGRAVGVHPFGAGTLAAGALAVGCFGVLPQLVAVVAGRGATALAVTLAIAVPAYLVAARQLRRPLALNSFARLRRTDIRRSSDDH